jgi:hypothetical protein
MRRRILRSTLAACALAAAFGCSSYRYMRDSTPDLESSRFDYVENNPGNKFNDDIESGRVRKGMSRLQVRVTWGDPDDVAPQPPNSELWSYEEQADAAQTVATVYQLRFDGEILTDIDTDRRGVNLLSTEDRERRQRRQDADAGTGTDPTRKPNSR